MRATRNPFYDKNAQDFMLQGKIGKAKKEGGEKPQSGPAALTRHKNMELLVHVIDASEPTIMVYNPYTTLSLFSPFMTKTTSLGGSL